VTSATARVQRSQHHGGTQSYGLEVTGSGFAINPRRFITCHHNVFNETTSTNCDRVAICTKLKKNGNQIIPHPQFPIYSANLLQFDVDLDFAIFELLPNEPDLVPIPICPINSLPSTGYPNLGCIYGAIGDFLLCDNFYLSFCTTFNKDLCIYQVFYFITRLILKI